MRRCALVLLLAVYGSLQGQDIDVSHVCSEFRSAFEGPSPRTIAVVDFTTFRGEVTELGRMLAEEFSVALTKCKGTYSLVDRTYVARLLREHTTFSNVSDAQVLKQIGKLSGADTLLTGSYTLLTDTVKVYAKAIDSSSTRILTATTMEIPKTPSMLVDSTAPVVPVQETQPTAGSEAGPRINGLQQRGQEGLGIESLKSTRRSLETLPQVWRNVSTNDLYRFRFDSDHLIVYQLRSNQVVADLALKRDKKDGSKGKYIGTTSLSQCRGGRIEVLDWSPTRIEARIEVPDAQNSCNKPNMVFRIRRMAPASFVPEESSGR